MKFIEYLLNRRTVFFQVLVIAWICVFVEVNSVKADVTLAVEKVTDVEDAGNSNNRSNKATAGRWKEKNQCLYYCKNGKRVRGLKEINNKNYYFDTKGVQRTGWQKMNGAYYYFQIANGKKGYQIKSKTVNGVKLASNGKAKLTTQNRSKLEVLVMANQIVGKAVKPAMTKSMKLKKTYDYLLKHYQYRGSPVFTSGAHWEQNYAKSMFCEYHGSCYAYGAAFAFLANAIGYQNCYAVSSGGHGWAEVDGKVYDPSWSLVDKRHSYFGVSFELSGIDGRPNYRKARRYVAKI